MTGQDLHELLLAKWGRSFGMQIRRIQGKIFVQVMWKYLEQVSFPMTEEEYIAHLDEITTYLNAWGSAEQIRTYIQETRESPRLGKAVSIPLDLGILESEWILDE